ncbi:MAG: hypothetical protein H0U76_28785 [Ktedonobacteraceae bacterium]|nr:hypothetical protein [Ktedonobacteraceae bacterium]
MTQHERPQQESSEKKVPPPPPAIGLKNPPQEYKLAIDTVNNLVTKPLPTADALLQREQEYTKNYEATSMELVPAESVAGFSYYGEEPFYHTTIRHKLAKVGYIYSWNISPASGVLITRDINKDNEVEKLLSLSDIIYYLITKEIVKIASLQPFQLTKIMQYNVASGLSYPIINYIGRSDLPKTFSATDEDSSHFKALLGSANLRSAMYLIRDYGKYLGITGIASITLLDVFYEKDKKALGLSLVFN